MPSNLTLLATMLCFVLPLGYSGIFPTPVAGQQISIKGLPTLSGQAEDRLRVRQLLGQATTEGYLIRTPSSLLKNILIDDSAWSITLLAPEIRGVKNSNLPFSFNDGPLWAGRGWNRLVTIGARAQLGPITMVIAPQFIYLDNESFHLIPYPVDAYPERNA